MSYINHPLVNDPLYGNIVNENNMYLKANILVFKHPITKKKIKIII
jgi:23S rRNA-/tRNA-specific pseudouridylate synthase